MINYVAGFLFSEDLQYVLLIKKNRPDWQAGKLNAVGGKIEDNEHPHAAMCREFKEETGLDINDWQPVCTLASGVHLWDSEMNADQLDWQVHFYVAITSEDNLLTAKQQTDEELVVGISNTQSLYDSTIPNLAWLIPMAKETLSLGSNYFVAEG